jgi:colanic acid biosynthesis glycosyl transferase WcaI
MAKILILSLVFPPDNVSTAQIMGDLSKELLRLGNDIIVVTSTPHYNLDPIAEKQQPLKKYLFNLVKKSKYNGIPVFHIYMPRKGKNPLLRALSWTWFSIAVIISPLFFLKKIDVIFCPSPPLTLGLSAYIISRLLGAQYIYNVQEIYPDFAINSGYLKNRLLIKILYSIEKFIYSKAKLITVIGKDMSKNIILKGISQKKVIIIPNFVDTNYFRPMPKENQFRKEFNLCNKFVISYAGNIGPGQDIESLIKAAYLLREINSIHFILVGAGMLFDKIAKEIDVLNLKNVTLIGFQPYSKVPEIYAASDLCFVPQDGNIVGNAIPSKVYRIMASGRPILSTTTERSDLYDLIKESNCGLICQPNSPKDIADKILWAVQNNGTLIKMGMSARNYVEKYYSKENIAKTYHVIFSRLN